MQFYDKKNIQVQTIARIGALLIFLLYLTLLTTDILHVFGSANFSGQAYEITFFYAARLVGSLALLCGALYHQGSSWRRNGLFIGGITLIFIAFSFYPGTPSSSYWEANIIRVILLFAAGIFALIGIWQKK